MIELKAAFEKYNLEHLEFDRVLHKLNNRPDLCAFLLLDKLVPAPDHEMVTSSNHDEVFLHTDCEELAKVATDEDILMLTRCGVRYDTEYECLAMFV